MSTESITSTAAAYTSAAFTAVVGVVQSSGVVALVGLLIAVATFAVNWYYKRQMLALQREMRDEWRERRKGSRDSEPAPLGIDG